MLYYIEQEIASQPACWHQAAAALGATEGLPRQGERVAVIGCGTSLFVAQAYAALREAAGHGETDAFQASEFPLLRRYDRVLAISRSGTTTEVLTALNRLHPTPTTVITSEFATPAGDIAQHAVVLDFAAELSVVQTRFATTVLALLRAQLGADIGALALQAEEAVVAPLPCAPGDFRQFTFLGSGWTVGIAAEAAHKLRETARAWTEAHIAMDYRHGANCLADEGTFVWFLGVAPDNLPDEIRRTGATVHLGPRDPLVELILAQRLAFELAVSRGLDPDRPRNLQRSIVLS
jgi:fructoselysine-6-P-deglycase FrlB-like protein